MIPGSWDWAPHRAPSSWEVCFSLSYSPCLYSLPLSFSVRQVNKQYLENKQKNKQPLLKVFISKCGSSFHFLKLATLLDKKYKLYCIPPSYRLAGKCQNPRNNLTRHHVTLALEPLCFLVYYQNGEKIKVTLKEEEGKKQKLT